MGYKRLFEEEVEEIMAKRFEKAKAYTEKYKHLLQPCQYCGNTDIHIVSDKTSVWDKPKDGYSVCCSTPYCDCTTVFTSVKAAIESWNSHRKRTMADHIHRG